MIALRVRCWVVTNSERIINYLLEDGHEFIDNLVLSFWGQTVPDLSRWDRHKTSYWDASVTNSVTLSLVIFVPKYLLAGVNWVADKGIRKRIWPWYFTHREADLFEIALPPEWDREINSNFRPNSGCIGSVISISVGCSASGLLKGVLTRGLVWPHKP